MNNGVQQGPSAANAPTEAIQAFCAAMQVNRGTHKQDSNHAQVKERAENVIIEFMKSNQMTYIPMADGRYIVVTDKTKMCGWSDEVVARCYMMYHNNNMQQGKSMEKAAVDFVEFCKKYRKHSSETKVSLKIAKRRPALALLQEVVTGTGAM